MKSTPASGTVRAYRRGDSTVYTAVIQAINEDGTVNALVFTTASQPHQTATLHVIEPGADAPADAEWWCEAGAFDATPVADDVDVGDVADGDVVEQPPDPTPVAPSDDAGGAAGGGGVSDRLAPLAERIDTLTARVDALNAQVDALVAVHEIPGMDDSDGGSLLT